MSDTGNTEKGMTANEWLKEMQKKPTKPSIRRPTDEEVKIAEAKIKSSVIKKGGQN